MNDNTQNKFAFYGLEILKRSVLLVLYENQKRSSIHFTRLHMQQLEILRKLGIPKLRAAGLTEPNHLIHGILAHLEVDGYTEYLLNGRWRITKKGILVFEEEN